MPRYLMATLIIVAFIALGTSGWDSWFAASLLAEIPLVGLFILLTTSGGRYALFGGSFPTIASLLFAVTICEALLQLVPVPPGLAHPAWGLLGTFKLAPATLDVEATRIEIGKLAGLGAAFLVGVSAGRDSRDAAFLLRTVLVAGLLFAMWFVADQVFSAVRGVATAQLAGGAGGENVAATIFGCLVLLAFANIIRATKEGGGRRFMASFKFGARGAGIAWIALVVALIALVLTGSSAGIAATCIGALIFFLLEGVISSRGGPRQRRVGWRSTAMWLGLITLCLIGLLASGASFLEHFQSTDVLQGGRSAIYAAHWDAFLQLPWLGHGLGTFAVINNVYMPHQHADALQNVSAAHNVYLQWLEEGGLVGASAMFACVGLLVWGIGFGLYRRRRDRTWLRLGLALIALVAIHSFVEFSLNVYAAALLAALFLGLFWSLARQ